MDREVSIKDFFTFLKESRPDENSIDLVIGRLGLEIQQERLAENGHKKNNYLESLLEIKNGPLEEYLAIANKGTRKEALIAFRNLMDLLVRDVRLHGLDRV